MLTIHATFIVLLILFSGILMLLVALRTAQFFTGREISIRSLFLNFRQKMWMTIGLGVLFFGFYSLLIYAFSFMDNPTVRLNFFFAAYKNPIIFIYLGLLTFASISVSIYLARMAIKYFCNRRF